MVQNGSGHVSDREYIEPTNEQLARFLVVYVPAQTGLDLHPSASILERLLETKPDFRKAALGHHRAFQDQIAMVDARMKAGDLPCAYIRANGKPCPNHNQSGSYYCGLHQDGEA